MPSAQGAENAKSIGVLYTHNFVLGVFVVKKIQAEKRALAPFKHNFIDAPT